MSHVLLVIFGSGHPYSDDVIWEIFIQDCMIMFLDNDSTGSSSSHELSFRPLLDSQHYSLALPRNQLKSVEKLVNRDEQVMAQVDYLS